MVMLLSLLSVFFLKLREIRVTLFTSRQRESSGLHHKLDQLIVNYWVLGVLQIFSTTKKVENHCVKVRYNRGRYNRVGLCTKMINLA
jgi:hypothetical protein